MDERPITRAEMVELFTAQKQEILDGVQEQIRDSQTKILNAFSSFQEHSKLRIRLGETTAASMMDLMTVLERRLQEIEKGLFINRPAA
jgi:hypothetical protein